MLLLALILQLQSSFTRHEFTSAEGMRAYWLYVPSAYDAKQSLPAIVMLHGCTQDGQDIARGSRLNEHAEKHGFIVVYPEQPQSANPLKCWNWFDVKHQERDKGEPAIIAGIIHGVLSKYNVDAKRVYLAGLSAGAAMANIVAIAYPELVAGLGLHAGIEYKATNTVLNARIVMNKGGPDPVQQGKLAFAAMGERKWAFPVLIVNGEADQSVPPLHAKQLETQWQTIHQLMDAKPSVRAVVVPGLGHALSGGSPAGTFTDPNGPDAISDMLRFFGLIT